MVKTLKKPSSPEPKGFLMTLKLGKPHRVLVYYQVCSNDDPGLTLTYFTARLNLLPYCMGKTCETMDFLKTIVVTI